MSLSQQNLPQRIREFVRIPETILPSGTIVPEFKVGKYLCGYEGDQLVINSTTAPWVNISFYDAKTEAKKAGLALITELQYLALAYNIAGVPANWSGGAVGEGHLFQGLHNCTVDQPQAGNYVSEDDTERRWFELSNGERVFDVAGNCYTWVFDDVQGDEGGIIAKPFAEDSPSITTAPTRDLAKHVGYFPDAGLDRSGYALNRGGSWDSLGLAGIFSLGRSRPDFNYEKIGFRCTSL